MNRIVRIPYRGLKLRALKRFEEQERKILSERENPLIRSQALDRVTNAIASIEGAIHQEQHGELDFLQQIRRNLFHEDDTNAVREVPGMFFSPWRRPGELPVTRQLNFDDSDDHLFSL